MSREVTVADASWADDLIAGVREIAEAAPDYLEAEEYYTGNVPEVFASNRIRRIIARTGERYKFALASTPVRVLADRVVLTGVSTGVQAMDDVIAAVRTANRMQLLEPELHLDVFKYGDAYLFSWPVLDDQDAVIGLRVLHNGPETVRAVYSDDDPHEPTCVVRSWVEPVPGGKRRRADIYYDTYADEGGDKEDEHPARIERWVTKPGADAKGRSANDWTQYLDPDQADWLIEHDYGQPWSHFRNGSPYGTPEHALAYGAQDALAKMLITQITTTDSHGWPQRYGLVDKDAVLDENNDDPDWDDDTDADDDGNPVGGTSTGKRNGPGTMQTLTGMREVGQFAAADPTVFLTPVDVYVRLMSQLTGTPLWEFDPSKEQPSGVSRRRGEAPLIAKIVNREAYLTATWEAFWGRALRLLTGGDVPAVTVSWAPASVIDDTEGLDVLAAKRALGVPVEQLLVEAGYTAEQAAAWAKDAAPLPEQLLADTAFG
jgi:hypothetical protein